MNIKYVLVHVNVCVFADTILIVVQINFILFWFFDNYFFSNIPALSTNSWKFFPVFLQN